jgi:hypothetical protein
MFGDAKKEGIRGVPTADADAVLQTAIAALSSGRHDGLATTLEALNPEPSLTQCIARLTSLGLDRDTAWLLLVHWYAGSRGGDLGDAGEAVAERALSNVSGDQWREALVTLVQALG